MVRAPKSHEGPLSASSCHSLVTCCAYKSSRDSFGARWRVLRALPVSCGAASSHFYGPLGDTRSPYEVCRPRGEHPTRGSHLGSPDSFWARFPYSHALPRTLQNTYHIRTNSVIWRPWRLLGQIPLFRPPPANPTEYLPYVYQFGDLAALAPPVLDFSVPFSSANGFVSRRLFPIPSGLVVLLSQVAPHSQSSRPMPSRHVISWRTDDGGNTLRATTIHSAQHHVL